jgi:SUMO ligase MMS21 Smc5/6 complex component
LPLFMSISVSFKTHAQALSIRSSISDHFHTFHSSSDLSFFLILNHISLSYSHK